MRKGGMVKTFVYTKFDYSLSIFRASLAAQLVRICLQCRRPQFNFWVGKMCWRRGRLSTPVFLGFLGGSAGKNQPAMWETWVRSLGWEDPLEEGMAIHPSILASRIPRTMWSLGLQRPGHDLATFTITFEHI